MPAVGLCDAAPPLLAHVLPFLIALVGGPGSAGSSSNVSRTFLCDFTKRIAAHLAETNITYIIGSQKGACRGCREPRFVRGRPGRRCGCGAPLRARGGRRPSTAGCFEDRRVRRHRKYPRVTPHRQTGVRSVPARPSRSKWSWTAATRREASATSCSASSRSYGRSSSSG